MEIDSKTTFVTVNQLQTQNNTLQLQHSKTTFVTVNHKQCNNLWKINQIQKQHLLLLISIINANDSKI